MRGKTFGEEKAYCESRSTTYWNSMLCQCSQVNTCLGSRDNEYESDIHTKSYANGFDIIGYIFLGSCITIALLLSATTIYYRRKLKKLINTEDIIEIKKTKRSGVLKVLPQANILQMKVCLLF